MKKFINRAIDTPMETLEGFAVAHSNIILLEKKYKFVKRKNPTAGKVALVSGGGSGHEPMHVGFVGYGMLDAACVGQVFTSPSPDQITAAAKAVGTPAGVLFIVKNYDGDRMNFEIAREIYHGKSRLVIVSDDVGIGGHQSSDNRRGVAGTLVMEKILGAAAEGGHSLDELQELGFKINLNTRSMGVALTSGTVPAVGRPTFTIDADEIELGVGIHGEAGRRRIKHKTANGIAEELVTSIVDDLKQGGEALLVVNGFGGTPLMELYIMFNACAALLDQRGIKTIRSLVGNYVTSLDMAGCSVTVTILDQELARLWDAPLHTSTLRWGM